MGLSLDKIRHFSKDDSNSDNKEPKDIEKKIESGVIIRKRNNSTNLKENKNLIKNNESQISNNQNNNENKIHKCLSFEKYEKIEEPIKNLDSSANNKDLLKESESELNCGKKNKAIVSNVEKEDINNNNINNNADESQSSEEGSDSKFNSISNKDLLIINENMKSLFLNSAKSVKEEDTTSTLFISDDKNSPNNSTQETIDYELNFYRSGNAIRNSYIQRLVTKALFLPNNKPKSHNSLIIFDWDDTLLPTTFLTQGGAYNENMILTDSEKKKFEKLENSALNLLNIAISKGDVYIITNAGLGWVEFSAKKYYPKIYEILPKIKIISARCQWENVFPNDTKKWKIQTFLSLQKELNTKLVTNIICLGDSLYEMEAGRILANCFTEAFVKTIKFKEGPKLEELYKQLMLVNNQFTSICSAVKSLTIRVEKKKKGQ
jgi:hypothetical protein